MSATAAPGAKAHVTTTSAECFKEAKDLMPGGVSSPVMAPSPGGQTNGEENVDFIGADGAFGGHGDNGAAGRAPSP